MRYCTGANATICQLHHTPLHHRAGATAKTVRTATTLCHWLATTTSSHRHPRHSSTQWSTLSIWWWCREGNTREWVHRGAEWDRRFPWVHRFASLFQESGSKCRTKDRTATTHTLWPLLSRIKKDIFPSTYIYLSTFKSGGDLCPFTDFWSYIFAHNYYIFATVDELRYESTPLPMVTRWRDHSNNY